jgi:predicted Fe-S protein YdhL (DUF1289 family)
MLDCLDGPVVLRVGCEGLEMRRPESGFESAGRIRVFAEDSSSPAPQLGHERLSSSISDVHSGQFMARRIVTFKIRGGTLESLRPGHQTGRGPLAASRVRRRPDALTPSAAALLTSAAKHVRTAGRSMRDMEELFAALGESQFRRGFRLRGKELAYLRSKGLRTVLEHASDFIEKRLAPAEPANDGKQTPMRNHPAFVAQHATATCCRGCLQKWHGIPKGRALDAEEKRHVLSVLERWLAEQERAAAREGA